MASRGCWQGQTVRLGRADWAGARRGRPHRHLSARCPGAASAYAFTDRLRPGAVEAVAGLQAAGLAGRTAVGRHRRRGRRRWPRRSGIADWRAGLLPAEDKAARLAALAAEGHRVLMVGDGLNDTAALAAAHVSISPASALDAARVVSDIVLLGGDAGADPRGDRPPRAARAAGSSRISRWPRSTTSSRCRWRWPASPRRWPRRWRCRPRRSPSR